MDRRGIALIMVFWVIVVLAILSSSFFYSVINENRLLTRFLNSTRAFWLAETGIAEAIDNNLNDTSGILGDSKYTWSADVTPLPNNYYKIDSIGTVILPSGGLISRSLTAIAKTEPANPSNFQHAIRTTGDLVIKGSVDINGPQEEQASLIFADLFGSEKTTIKAFVEDNPLLYNYFTDPPVDVGGVEGLTWVDISPGGEFKISSSGWSGSGILIVNGDAQITGGTFNGIIYVFAGILRMSGNPTVNGTILVEGTPEIDTKLTGNITINYDPTVIANALGPLQFLNTELKSWDEVVN